MTSYGETVDRLRVRGDAKEPCDRVVHCSLDTYVHQSHSALLKIPEHLKRVDTLPCEIPGTFCMASVLCFASLTLHSPNARCKASVSSRVGRVEDVKIEKN